MISIRRLAPLLLAVVPTAGCGQATGGGNSSGGIMSALVAEQVAKDCESPEAVRQAPNLQMRQHLHRLCSCTKERIASTPIGFDESDDSTNRKVQAAMQFCSDEIGGAPGEGRAEKKSRSGH